MFSISIFRTELRQFLPLFGPLLISQYAQMANGIIDTIMAARLGSLELASVAVGVAMWMPIYMFVIGVLFASLIVIAQYFGANDKENVCVTAWQGMWLGLGLGLCASGLLLLVASNLEWFGTSGDVGKLSENYLRMLLLGLPFGAVAVAMRFYCEGQGLVFPITIMAVLVVGCNALFNYLLMFGNFGFPEMGIEGCGLATALSMVFFLVMLIGYTTLTPRFADKRLLKKIYFPQFDAIKGLFKLGLPIGFGITSEFLILSIITLFIGSTGAIPVAAHQVAFSCMMLFFATPAALSFAASIRVGNLIGLGDSVALRDAVNSLLMLCSFIGLLISCLMYFYAEPLAFFIADDPQVASIAAGLIKIAAFFQFVDAIQVCCNGILRGAGDTTVPFAITASLYWLLCIPLGYILSGNPLPGGLAVPMDLFGIKGWWISLIITLTLVALLLFRRVYNRLIHHAIR